MKNLLSSIWLCLLTAAASAQIVIDSVVSSPHASAMVDIKSGTKGLLVPRLSNPQRTAIQKPAAGLLVYDVDDQAFYYYKGEYGWVMLLNQLDKGFDIPYSAAGSIVGNLFSLTQLSNTGGNVSLAINNTGNTQPVLKLAHGGAGTAINAAITYPASTSEIANFANAGIGSGVRIQLTNASNGARGLDVLQNGVGPGVFATSAGGNAVWGITSSISAAGVIGDNTFGEAVVGRNRGGNGVGAVVGRNDSSGYGVRGFNTKTGIGVLGQTGISGATGVGGRFENVNGANGNDALQAATNGTGYAANFTSSNNSNATKGLRIATTAGQGGTALTIANGKVMASWVDPYVSGALIDDFHLIVRATGNCSLSTSNVALGTIVLVTNFSGGTVTITNTQSGNLNIINGRSQMFTFFGGAIWTATQ